MALINGILFAIGLVLLVGGANYFIKSAATIAKRLGVSEFVIGLTIVAMGTSLPELASSIAASLKQQSGLVIGNVVGSNVANVGLIIGLTAIFAGIMSKKQMIKRDGYIMIFASGLLWLFVMNGVLSRLESFIFVLLYLAYVTFLFQSKPHPREKYQFGRFIQYFLGFKYLTTIRSRIDGYREHRKHKKSHSHEIRQLVRAAIIKDLFVLLFSGAAITIGAGYLIAQATYFAIMFNIPDTLIGISLIAVGTSIPELTVSLVAAKKGFNSIALGNIIGSNISNIFLVLGIAGLISPISIDRGTIIFSIPYMIAISVALLIFSRSELKIKPVEGLTLLIAYVLFMTFLFA